MLSICLLPTNKYFKEEAGNINLFLRMLYNYFYKNGKRLSCLKKCWGMSYSRFKMLKVSENFMTYLIPKSDLNLSNLLISIKGNLLTFRSESCLWRYHLLHSLFQTICYLHDEI